MNSENQMKLADLTRPEKRARRIRNAALICSVLFLVYAALVERKNAMLTEANLALVGMLDVQLSESEARLDLLQQMQRDLIDALREGDVTAAAKLLEDR